jgi:hypothetical protein
LISRNGHGKANQSLSHQVEYFRQRALRLQRQPTNAGSKQKLKIRGICMVHGIVKSRDDGQFVCRNWKFSCRKDIFPPAKGTAQVLCASKSSGTAGFRVPYRPLCGEMCLW